MRKQKRLGLVGLDANLLVGDALCPVSVRDITMSGASLISERVIPLDSEVVLVLKSGEASGLRLKGRIMRVQDMDDMKDRGNVELALEFIISDDSASAVRTLFLWLERL